MFTKQYEERAKMAGIDPALGGADLIDQPVLILTKSTTEGEVYEWRKEHVEGSPDWAVRYFDMYVKEWADTSSTDYDYGFVPIISDASFLEEGEDLTLHQALVRTVVEEYSYMDRLGYCVNYFADRIYVREFDHGYTEEFIDYLNELVERYGASTYIKEGELKGELHVFFKNEDGELFIPKTGQVFEDTGNLTDLFQVSEA